MCDLKVLGVTANRKTQAVLNEICAGACHIALISLQVKNLEALKLACQRLGLEFREGQMTYAWYGRSMGDAALPEGFTKEDLGKCSHAIHVPGASYEIGVVYREGVYKLLWDSWGSGGLVDALGKDCNKLRQAYGVSAAMLEAQRQGYSCWETQGEDGAIKLHVTLPA